MAGILKWTVTQLSGGHFAPDNDVASPGFKHLGSGTIYPAVCDGTFGEYKATNDGAGCPDGYYVFVTSTTVIPRVLGSAAEGGTWFGDGTLPYMAYNGTEYDADSKKIINLANPTTDTGALTRITGDGRYILASVLTGLMDLASTQTATGTKTFNIIKATQLGAALSLAGWKITGDVSDDSDVGSSLMNKAWIEGAIASAVDAVEAVPYQESVNEIRLMPGGSTKVGQVYTSWNDAFQYLKSLTPSATKRFVVTVCGHGISGSESVTITKSDAGYAPGYFNNYCSIFMKNRKIRLLIPDGLDGGMSVTAGTMTVEGGTLFLNNGSATPTFTNMHFVNVYFDLTVGSVVFTGCTFESCFIKVNDDSDASATFTTCKGSGVTSNQDFGGSAIDGWVKSKDDF